MLVDMSFQLNFETMDFDFLKMSHFICISSNKNRSDARVLLLAWASVALHVQTWY